MFKTSCVSSIFISFLEEEEILWGQKLLQLMISSARGLFGPAIYQSQAWQIASNPRFFPFCSKIKTPQAGKLIFVTFLQLKPIFAFAEKCQAEQRLVAGLCLLSNCKHTPKNTHSILNYIPDKKPTLSNSVMNCTRLLLFQR